MRDYKNAAIYFLAVFLSVFMLIGLSSCGTDEDERVYEYEDWSTAIEPRHGGVFRVAYGDDPGHFDLQLGTGWGYAIGDHIYERLFDIDAVYNIHGDLAKDYQVSENFLVHTITLHEGVKFHNGKELTAEDVVASVNRWITIIASPPELADVFDRVVARDRYVVEFHLTRPHPDFKQMVAGSTLAIYPREVCEKYPDSMIPNNELVGTGPYRMVEYINDRYAHLVRFEDYEPRGEEIPGRAGRKNAYFDELHYTIMPDPMVRMMGVESGQFDFGWGTDYKEYDRLLEHPHLWPRVNRPWEFLVMTMNCNKAPTSNVKFRQAVSAAIDVEEIMQAGLADGLYEMSPSKMWLDIEHWFTEAGGEYYNQNDPTLARQLLEEAGYNGEPIILLGISDYAFLRDGAIVAEQQLSRAGFNVDLQMCDVGTFIARYMGGDFHIGVHTSSVASTPTSYGWTRDTHIGWWTGETPRKKELGALLRSETDQEKRLSIWEDLQRLSYEEANHVWLGAYFSVSAAAEYVMAPEDNADGRGYGTPGGRFWNWYFRDRN